MDFMDYYKESILELAREERDEVFYNSSARHAKMVHLAIVETARRDISFYCGGFPTDIVNNDEYCKSMEKFLLDDSSRKVEVIISPSNPNENISKTLREKSIIKVLGQFKSQVCIYRYGGCVKYQGNPVHFTFSDDRMFRLETDIQEHVAFGNFNSQAQVATLKQVFEKIKSDSILLNVFS